MFHYIIAFIFKFESVMGLEFVVVCLLRIRCSDEQLINDSLSSVSVGLLSRFGVFYFLCSFRVRFFRVFV